MAQNVNTTERDQDMALVPYEPTREYGGMLMPLATPQEARAAITAYEQLKAAIARPEDFQSYQGKPFLKKSFWRRVATCFGLSLEVVREDRGHDEGGRLFYSVLYRAVAPNGRTMIGDGYCGTAEPGHGAWTEHVVRATAHTRAKNRAISDLVGGGEVSAEEMPDGDDQPRRTAQPAQAQQTRTAPASRPAPVRRAPAPPVEIEPHMTFVEAAQADSDAVTDDAAPRTVPLLFEAWKDAGLSPGEFAPHARKSGGDVDKLIAAVWPRIQAARAGAASDYNLHDLPMAAHGSH